jgi:hypothetical protein
MVVTTADMEAKVMVETTVVDTVVVIAKVIANLPTTNTLSRELSKPEDMIRLAPLKDMVKIDTEVATTQEVPAATIPEVTVATKTTTKVNKTTTLINLMVFKVFKDKNLCMDSKVHMEASSSMVSKDLRPVNLSTAAKVFKDNRISMV